MDYEKLEARVSIIEHFLKKLDKEMYEKLLSKAMKELENEKKKEEKQMHDKIMSILKRDGKISASMIQKNCKIGYAHACRILDELESTGIIGPASGSKPRKLLSLRKAKLFNKNLTRSK